MNSLKPVLDDVQGMFTESRAGPKANRGLRPGPCPKRTRVWVKRLEEFSMRPSSLNPQARWDDHDPDPVCRPQFNEGSTAGVSSFRKHVLGCVHIYSFQNGGYALAFRKLVLYTYNAYAGNEP